MSILFNWVVEPRILFCFSVLFDSSGCAVTITREDGYIYHTIQAFLEALLPLLHILPIHYYYVFPLLFFPFFSR